MNIEKFRLLDPDRLSGEFYLASLLAEANRCGLLTEDELQAIQIACLELLAYKTRLYTDGESSSVRIELAESIMTSNFYTIGLYLKSLPNPDDAVELLKETPVSELYKRGRKLVDTKLKTARLYYEGVHRSMLTLENDVYHATLEDGIAGFFKLYRPDYAAHEVHITADYPLCNAVTGLVGIEFIQKYLESAKFENAFCRQFPLHAVHHLLCGYDAHYQSLIFNLFEPVLTCALGCVLTRADATALVLTPTQVEQLQVLFEHQTRSESVLTVQNACKTLCGTLSLTSEHLRAYLEAALPSITTRILDGAKNDTLDRVFLTPAFPESNPHIYVAFGAKMDDEEYRAAVAEIARCRHLSDKVALIRGKIRSLADLEDVVYDAMLNDEEITAVLGQLELTEVATLSKRCADLAETQDPSDEQAAFYACLRRFIASLPPEKRAWLEKACELIVFEETL